MKQPRNFQIHLKSEKGPIHVLLVNKDAAADSPVVTPVPPPANDINSNNHQAVNDGHEPMETSENSKQLNEINSKDVAVKTEVLESSRGTTACYVSLCLSFFLSQFTEFCNYVMLHKQTNLGSHIKFVYVVTGSNFSAKILGQFIIGNRCILFYLGLKVCYLFVLFFCFLFLLLCVTHLKLCDINV